MEHTIILKLTSIEIETLGEMLDVLRNTQGDGTLDDAHDDALVSLNDKIEEAIKTQPTDADI
jgi:hypothetical protein